MILIIIKLEKRLDDLGLPTEASEASSSDDDDE